MDKGIRLDEALLKRGLARSRTEAKELIEKGAVLLNGRLAAKASKIAKIGDSIEVIAPKAYVSRGGEKLEGVFLNIYGNKEAIANALKNKEAIDIGSSTGGFTDCLLKHGIAHVDAVDVGRNQFHDSLKNEKRVNLYENQDIRDFKKKKYDIVVADLSFISIISILPTVFLYGGKGSEYYLLLKPQFEVGKGNTKKGIVKDNILVQNVLEEAKEKAASYFKERAIESLISIFPSKIKGGDGNQEYFLHIKL